MHPLSSPPFPLSGMGSDLEVMGQPVIKCVSQSIHLDPICAADIIYILLLRLSGVCLGKRVAQS